MFCHQTDAQTSTNVFLNPPSMINVLVLSLLFWKLGPFCVVLLISLTAAFQTFSFFLFFYIWKAAFYFAAAPNWEGFQDDSWSELEAVINAEISDPLDSCWRLNENSEMNVSVLAKSSERWKILSCQTESDTWDTWAHIISTFIYRWLLCNLCERSEFRSGSALSCLTGSRIHRKRHLKAGKL